jgi:hypothetical protein
MRRAFFVRGGADLLGGAALSATLPAASPPLLAAWPALSASEEAALVTALVRIASLRFWVIRKKATIATRASTAMPMITPPMPEPPRST